MRLLTIADLHLSLASNKPMDIFGSVWEGYMNKIENNWQNIVGNDDVVVIPGDISWAMNLKEAYSDFSFLDNLNGRKFLIKGNHDFWWETVSKMNRFFNASGFSTMSFIHNCAAMFGEVAICGTRGWFIDLDDATGHNEKVFNREVQRLETSLKDAKRQGCKDIFVFLHYPPICKGYECCAITDLLKKYNVSKCFYGHLHGDSQKRAVTGIVDGIEYNIVAADYLNFKPLLIL